jgi:acetoin utilization deacetylase AcuC-like enzyme
MEIGRGVKQCRKDIAIYWHKHCVDHAIANHPEQPARVSSILQELRRHWSEEIFREAPLVTEDQIRLFHSAEHISKLNTLSCRAQIAHEKKLPNRVQMIDQDTMVMHHTLEAAKRAAGSIVSAIDDCFLPVSDPRAVRRAFCCVRPPGHHAERGRSMGFCFLNNAGIAARYAQQKYGVKKVAVLDFDVHHGNGTEEGFADDPSLFYGSTHEKDNYPGTGQEPKLKNAQAVTEVDRRIVNRYLPSGPSSKKVFRWEEEESRLLCDSLQSLHLFYSFDLISFLIVNITILPLFVKMYTLLYN